MREILVSSDANVARAADALRCGALVAFPTETVYGLGGNAHADESVLKIFRRKGRPQSKPLSVCYADFAKALDDVEIEDRALILAEKFLPGPLTIVLKRRSSSKLSSLCSAGLETIGVRVPYNRTALDLLSRLPFPLAAPSANRSGESSPRTAQEVFNSLENNENLIILDGGPCSIGVESTIVDLTNNQITRIGAISPEQIKREICLDGIK
ncbi:MAG: threonylcarbamoyl-AMP synthase [Holosporaceae bacterium]|jgi:L-threonylcarbamoyladenylate synthase|nr:threonylcarbamoyl-AMP synthase [Holosporaceae bacterium]